jgi:hypothetical protein
MLPTELYRKWKYILCTVTFGGGGGGLGRLWDDVEKCISSGQATDDNVAHAHCILDNSGYKHTLRICNTAFPLQQWLHERASVLTLYMPRVTCNRLNYCVMFCSTYRRVAHTGRTAYSCSYTLLVTTAHSFKQAFPRIMSTCWIQVVFISKFWPIYLPFFIFRVSSFLLDFFFRHSSHVFRVSSCHVSWVFFF